MCVHKEEIYSTGECRRTSSEKQSVLQSSREVKRKPQVRLTESDPQYIMCLSFFRSNTHLSSAIPLLRVGQLNSHHLLSELSTREKNMRKMLEGKRKVEELKMRGKCI